jgi:hypothetical protein
VAAGTRFEEESLVPGASTGHDIKQTALVGPTKFFAKTERRPFSSTAPRLTKRGSPISMFLVFMSHWAVCERSHMTFGFREWLPVSQRSDLHLKSSWHSVPNGTDCQRLEYLLWFFRISFHSVVAHVGIMEVCNGCGGSRNCRNRPGEPCSTPDNSCSALPCISPRVVCRPPMNTPSIAIKMRFVDCLKD